MNQNKKLIEFRKILNLSQEEMAKTLNVSTSFYVKIELGLRNPSFNFIRKFKAKFEVDVDDIFFNGKLHLKCKNVNRPKRQCTA